MICGGGSPLLPESATRSEDFRISGRLALVPAFSLAEAAHRGGTVGRHRFGARATHRPHRKTRALRRGRQALARYKPQPPSLDVSNCLDGDIQARLSGVVQRHLLRIAVSNRVSQLVADRISSNPLQSFPSFVINPGRMLPSHAYLHIVGRYETCGSIEPAYTVLCCCSLCPVRGLSAPPDLAYALAKRATYITAHG